MFVKALLSYLESGTAAYTFISTIRPDPCPKALAGTADWPCDGRVDFTQQDSIFASALGSKGTLNNVAPDAIGNGPALNNLFQVLYSAVRLDIGYILPSNILTNASTFDAVIDIAVANTLSRDRQDPAAASIGYPLTPVDQAVIDITYQCRFKYQKSGAEIFLSVSVATASLFAGGWAILTFVAGWLAEREHESEQI